MLGSASSNGTLPYLRDRPIDLVWLHPFNFFHRTICSQQCSDGIFCLLLIDFSTLELPGFLSICWNDFVIKWAHITTLQRLYVTLKRADDYTLICRECNLLNSPGGHGNPLSSCLRPWAIISPSGKLSARRSWSIIEVWGFSIFLLTNCDFVHLHFQPVLLDRVFCRLSPIGWVGFIGRLHCPANRRRLLGALGLARTSIGVRLFMLACHLVLPDQFFHIGGKNSIRFLGSLKAHCGFISLRIAPLAEHIPLTLHL